jgi:CrcB protein
MKLTIIGRGGFFGAILRYLSSKYINLFFFSIKPSNVPWGTLFVNVVGSFILGYFYTLSIERLAVSENFRMFLGVGFLGAFTTFSTFSLETLNLFEEGLYTVCLLNVLLNVVLSIFFAYLGIVLARI